MKHFYPKHILLCLCLFVGTKAFASYAKIGSIYYNFIGDDEAEVTYGSLSGNSYSGAVVIPKSVTYNGKTYNVTSIGERAFYKCDGLTSVSIPSSVTIIGIAAFQDCSSLTSINIPEGVTEISLQAFKNCSSLTPINIPSSVTVIRNYVFSGCRSLTSILIPNSVISIGSYAFENCSNMTSISIIPNSNTRIESSAFSGCTSLEKVIVPDIAAWCRISFSNSEANPLSKAHHLYSSASTEIIHLVIPEGVTGIGAYAFYGCNSMTSIEIPNSVKGIGSCAFYNCVGLNSVTIPNSVTSIGSSAFYNCFRLQTINCLNTTPPFCSSSTTFACSTDYVHSVYDIYTYATLHVPMGSGESYSRAYEWRYFNRIKEDIEIDGTAYYANLTVMQGTTGYTRQAVKADERYTFFIGTINDCQINAVSFNGVDVTDELVNGYYTTPEIKGESVLSISYDTSETAIASPKLNNVRVTGYDGEISIMNIEEPSDVFVYSTDGSLVGSIPAAFGSANISVPTNQLYVVQVDKRTYKIAL